MKDVIFVHLCVSQIDGKTMKFVLGFTGVLLHDLVKAASQFCLSFPICPVMLVKHFELLW